VISDGEVGEAKGDDGKREFSLPPQHVAREHIFSIWPISEGYFKEMTSHDIESLDP
jgi:hypothetical protein